MEVKDTILQLVREDEEQAFRLAFDQYYQVLTLYAYRITEDAQAAEDIVQDCFIQLWSKKRLQYFSGELDRFLFKIIKNCSLQYLEEKKKKESLSGPHPELPGAVWTPYQDEQEKIDKLYAVIHQLPDKRKQVFLMACLENKTYREIATELAISINTVKDHMKSALKFLREHLKEKDFLECLLFLQKKRSITTTLFPGFPNI